MSDRLSSFGGPMQFSLFCLHGAFLKNRDKEEEMNYSRHRLKKAIPELKNLSGEQRERIEQSIINQPEPEEEKTTLTEIEDEEESESIESEEVEAPKRRRGRPARAN